ncbi:MAG: hypothetical protein HY876_10540 [Coriobacteriales bacterium]|nr:hypothetical protein [Coriobacteriales bacterium]
MRYPMEDRYHVLDQLGGLIDRARERFRNRGDAVGSLELSAQAIEIATSMEAGRFLSLDPPSMASYLEMSNTDDRVIEIVADALESQAEVADGSGLFIEASARREQAESVRDLLGPLHEN